MLLLDSSRFVTTVNHTEIKEAHKASNDKLTDELYDAWQRSYMAYIISLLALEVNNKEKYPTWSLTGEYDHLVKLMHPYPCPSCFESGCLYITDEHEDEELDATIVTVDCTKCKAKEMFIMLDSDLLSRLFPEGE